MIIMNTNDCRNKMEELVGDRDVCRKVRELPSFAEL